MLRKKIGSVLGLFWVAMVGSISACSAGEGDLTTLTPSAGDAYQTTEVAQRNDLERTFQEKVAGVMTADEEEAARAVLVSMSVNPDDVVFVGRMALLEDVYVDVDDLLVNGVGDGIEKGKVLTVTIGDIGAAGLPAAPHIYARRKPCTSTSECAGPSTCSEGTCSGTLQFWRPLSPTSY